MVHVLLLWQVGLFKVIVRQSGGRVHQRSSAVVVMNLIGPILQSLKLIRLAFGRLWRGVGG